MWNTDRQTQAKQPDTEDKIENFFLNTENKPEGETSEREGGGLGVDSWGPGYKYKQSIMIYMNEEVIRKPIPHTITKFLIKEVKCEDN